MSFIKPTPGGLIIRAEQAEIVGRAPSIVRLLADGSDTNGALTSQRVTLSDGADGATPHHHTRATELFFVLGGTVQILSGESVETADEGDLIVVPPNLAHAFAAPPGHDADLLIVLTPGLERFGYFRLLERLSNGEADLDELLNSQELYDNFFMESAAWNAARSRTDAAHHRHHD